MDPPYKKGGIHQKQYNKLQKSEPSITKWMVDKHEFFLFFFKILRSTIGQLSYGQHHSR